MPRPPAVPSPLMAITLGTAAGLWVAIPAAQAGLLRPLLDLLQPQLEARLAEACMTKIAGGESNLSQRVQQPCLAIANPTSRCLIEETDRSGRGLGVLSELLAGRFGEQSEMVVKRCLARLLGIRAERLEKLTLRELAHRLAPATALPKKIDR